ncbi:hypothetical protein BTRA_4677 [Burkholderia thailandensis USAMRU Malaysia |uniref:hypothetical protein n=1 Tax=Burkholderia thailandensis TaxID=57975 RepID=UPI0001B4108D|nr:hypothetical protein [Burkholderia thailandensis]AHI74897.1 hypothetical protein BTQ_5285 [Burkholderia thailandensis 2002721723]AHI81944.1 hypothetical protein BTJ_3921 [Burkholderia thailandensis E444]AIC89671.1 hypothetical protein BTRA_4677 [Burkholderia thailandensis USAMRU Malaysia \
MLHGLYRSFGAVVDEIEYETNRLETIALRNQRIPVNPLSDYFCEDLLAPLERANITRLRKEWRDMAGSLVQIIDAARDRHWKRDGPYRLRYCWRQAEIVEEEAYPAWAHHATQDLLRNAYSIFKRGGEAEADDGDLLTLARHYIRPHVSLTDAHLLSGLAIREAVRAVEHLTTLVDHVEQDEHVAVWLKEWLRQDVQDNDYARKAYGAELNARIDRAALDIFYPDLETVTDYRIHAEKLLLLADVCATGRLSSTESSRLFAQLEVREQHIEELDSAVAEMRAKRESFQIKGTLARTKLSSADKDEVKRQYDDLIAAHPDKQVKDIELTLADQWGVARSTIQRATGKKR